MNLADAMIGKAVEHMFETEEGPKEEWRGMVLARAPIMTTWFYITYEKDPVLYMYQLLDDYKEGDLRIMPDSSEWTKLIQLLLRGRAIFMHLYLDKNDLLFKRFFSLVLFGEFWHQSYNVLLTNFAEEAGIS